MSTKPNIFTMAEKILDAIEKNTGMVQDTAPDSPFPNHTHTIVVDPSFESEDMSMVSLSILLCESAFSQMANPKASNDSGQYEFSATRYKGQSCFFFRVPENENLDVPTLRKGLAKLQGLFISSGFTPANLNYDRASNTLLGPFNPHELKQFNFLLPRIANYYGNREGGTYLKSFDNEAGLKYIAIPKTQLRELHLIQSKERFN